jgi:hypothetical protein
LPPPSGRSELNFFASRSTIDTGLETLENQVIYNLPGVRKVTRQDVQQELTINNSMGFRFSTPLAATDKWRSTYSTGLDYKQYSLTSNKTNIFSFLEITLDENGRPLPPVVSTVHSAVPTTVRAVNYLPFSGRVDTAGRDALGTTTLGLGYSANLWYSGTESNLQFVTGSRHSTGHWVSLTPSISRDFNIYTNWVLSLRLDGQVATEPLISTEQFGAGGVNSVRGYHEGEVFGDCGWFVGAEQKTPAHFIGMINSRTPLSVNGAVYMGYAQTYLLDPNGQQSPVSLWGTGFGAAFSAGSHWEARFLFSWPLLTAGTTQAYEPRFDFSLSAQF